MILGEEQRFVTILSHHDQRNADSGCNKVAANVVASVIRGKSQFAEFLRPPGESVVFDGNQPRTFGRIDADPTRAKPAELLRAEDQTRHGRTVRLPLPVAGVVALAWPASAQRTKREPRGLIVKINALRLARALLLLGGGKNFFRFLWLGGGRQVVSDHAGATHYMKLTGLDIPIMRTNGMATAKDGQQRNPEEVDYDLSGKVRSLPGCR